MCGFRTVRDISCPSEKRLLLRNELRLIELVTILLPATSRYCKFFFATVKIGITVTLDVMKAYEGACITPLIPKLFCAPTSLAPCKIPRYPLSRKIVRLRFGLDVWDKKKFPILGIELMCIPAHSLDCTVH